MTTPDVVSCPACGTRTFIALSVGGHRLRLEPGRVPHGTVLPIAGDGTIRAHVLTGSELPAEGGAYVDHRKTCGKPAAGARPMRCFACRLPMHASLVDAGDAYHINCRPPTAAEIRAAVAQSSSPAVGAGEGLTAGDEPTLDLGEAS